MSVKRKNAQDYDPSSEVDPSLLTPSKRQRRNALSGDSIVDARHFFSGAPSAGAGPGPGWTPGARSGHANLQGPAAGYLVHWQSVQIFLHLDEDVERRSWDLLERTVQGTGDFAAGLQVGRSSGADDANIRAAYLIHLGRNDGHPQSVQL